MTKKKFENLEVGKTFELGCRKFKVVENDNGCKGCVFNKNYYEIGYICYDLRNLNAIPGCHPKKREDDKRVIFVEVEDE